MTTMADAGVRRTARRKRRFERVCAWGLVFAYELIAAATPAAVLAAILVPAAYAQRGYHAIGGEWLAIAAVFCVGYTAIHRRICDKIFGRRRNR